MSRFHNDSTEHLIFLRSEHFDAVLPFTTENGFLEADKA